MIEYAVEDLDSCAYLAASVANKVIYQWEHIETKELSPEFLSAQKAKDWIATEEGFEGLNPKEWKRNKREVDLGLPHALKALDNEMKSWGRTAIALTGNHNIKRLGYLTRSGLKDKDKKGLPKRYQHNRYDKKGLDYDDWVPKPRPKHLKACREHILTYYDYVKLSPEGIEADALCVMMAEKYGKKAVLMSKDKDLKQATLVNYIDMNPKERYRKMIFINELGHVDLVEVRPKDFEVQGTGFKLFCAQTCKGDPSDGYSGIHLYGDKKAFNLLDGCDSIEGCCEEMVSLYKTSYPEGFSYKSWDGVEMKLTWQEALAQHSLLAYHERGSKDVGTPLTRYLEGKQIIYTRHRK
jgi:hypothetical protein